MKQGQPPPGDTTGAPAVSIRQVSKTFHIDNAKTDTLKDRVFGFGRSSTTDFEAVSNVDIDIQRGETFGILGHNGSGKSTLLKMVAGIMKPTSGHIAVNGRLAALLELGAGFHPDLTGAENVYLNGAILGLNRNYVREVFPEIVAFAELADFVNVQVKYYSSGMQARLGFAVATHLDPEILLIDEVLAVGDERFQRKCMDRVQRIQGQGKTLILVSHSATVVGQLCDRSAVLSQGKLIFLGRTVDAIKAHREALESRYLIDNGPAAKRVEAPSSPVSISDSSMVPAMDDPVIQARDDLIVTVDVNVAIETDFRVRLMLRTEEGLTLFNRASSGLLGGPIRLPEGRHPVTFHLKDLHLRDGRYFVDLFTESPDGKNRFDRLGSAHTFRVEGAQRGLGLVWIDASCQSPAGDTGRIPQDDAASPEAQPVPAATGPKDQ